MKINFDVTAEEFHLIQDILSKHLNNQCKVWVFGSRAKNKTRFNSDLDLAIECAEKLPTTTLLALKEELDDAKITFAVDIVELNTVEDYFKIIINNQKVLFPLKSKIPPLRFPEFSGEWEEKTLEEISENGFSNGVFNDPSKVGKGYKLINVIDMYLETTIIEDKLTFIDISKSEFIKNKVEYGDIFFTRSSLVKEGIAYSNVYLGNSQDITFDGHLIRMRPIKKWLNPIFLNYMLKTLKVRKQLVMGGKTTTMTTIGQADIAIIKVSYPLLLEQQKIADFLTKIDEKIQQLTQKKKLLESYKKGVMQQLFSQQLRFKNDNGQDFPDWEYELLGNLVNFENGKAHEGYIIESGKYIVVNSKFISSHGFVFKTSNNALSLLKKESIVMVMSDVPNGKALAKCYFIETNNKYTLNQRICSITSKKLISKFLFYQLNRNPYYLKFDNGVGQTNLRKEDVLNCPIIYPSSKKEQTKIANFLTAIDAKINLVKQQLILTKEYKKGLLQQMFV